METQDGNIEIPCDGTFNVEGTAYKVVGTPVIPSYSFEDAGASSSGYPPYYAGVLAGPMGQGRLPQCSWKPWSGSGSPAPPKPNMFSKKPAAYLKKTIPLVIVGADDQKKQCIIDTVENVYIKIPEAEACTDFILNEFGKQLSPASSADELLLLDSKLLPITDSLSKGT